MGNCISKLLYLTDEDTKENINNNTISIDVEYENMIHRDLLTDNNILDKDTKK